MTGLYHDDLLKRTYHGISGIMWFIVGTMAFVATLVLIARFFEALEGFAVAYLPTQNPWLRGFFGSIGIVFLIALPILYLTWVERKLLARIQVRYGANRWGKFGLLQPIADAIKLLGKEDVVPAAANKIVFRLAPVILLAPLFITFVAIPWTSTLIPSRMEIGIIFILAVSSLAPIGGLMAGWGPNNKYNLIGGVRYAAQMVSYEVPLGLSVMGVAALARSFNPVTIADAQSGYWFGVLPKWFVFIQPIAFFVFLIAYIAESGRVPFDMMEDETLLVQGWTTEYSGMKFVLLLLGEYVHMVAGAALMVILFFGGWNGPTILPPLAWMLLKIILVILFMMWVRGTHFRTRIDQLLAIGWKVLLPLALINIGLTGIILALVVQ